MKVKSIKVEGEEFASTLRKAKIEEASGKKFLNSMQMGGGLQRTFFKEIKPMPQLSVISSTD